MQRLSENIALVRTAPVSNIWMLTDADGRRFLIDTGFRTDRLALKNSLRRAGVTKRGDIAAILLTHRHSDHAGNVAWLKERYDCPVFCHAYDRPILLGERHPKPLWHGVGSVYDRICCFLEDRFPIRTFVDGAFHTGPWQHGFHIYPAHGHTEGSVMIYHKPTETLFTGDALLTGFPPFRMFERFQLAFAAYSLDVEKCHRYVLDFLEDPPPIRQICPGHGPYVGMQAQDKLKAFRMSFPAN